MLLKRWFMFLISAATILPAQNIMKQAAGIKSLEGLLPGVTINTSATDFAPIKKFQLRKFKGERWELFGDVVSSEIDE